MLFATRLNANVTVELQYQGLLEVVLFSVLSTAPSCAFLFINGAMLHILRSKPVFRETSRYILLYNLLFADTVLLAQSQLLYILAACRVRLTYPVCGVVSMLATLTVVISPLTLVVMSLERYVAVCYPLRHAAIITIRNTELTVIVIWSFSSLNVLTFVVLLAHFPFGDLQMKDFCDSKSIWLYPEGEVHNKAVTYLVFLTAGVAISFSYIGVMVAARSASTHRASARKARNTLLLHMVQLGLSLSSTIHNSLLTAISNAADRMLMVRVQIFLYVCIIILPRCLSALIYGIRDQTIRRALISRFCIQCSPLLSAIPAKRRVHIHI